ncbi:hypothetical protein OG564_06185 [Streptomyces sp. NBC_01280]|uniref:hypothetical protein n=1 Tax=Streptomyces sp. NBC_01280 TaxID=2903810 RepID=UPI002E2FC996|nr:hypothetical protein [Streptomyces sp. NBC_01280]
MTSGPPGGSSASVPVRMTSDRAHDFRATQRVLGLGAVSVWPATFQQLVIRRTEADPPLRPGAVPPLAAGGRHADGVAEPGRRRGHVAALLSAS